MPKVRRPCVALILDISIIAVGVGWAFRRICDEMVEMVPWRWVLFVVIAALAGAAGGLRGRRMRARWHECKLTSWEFVVRWQVIALLWVVVGRSVRGRATRSTVGKGWWHRAEPRRQRSVLVQRLCVDHRATGVGSRWWEIHVGPLLRRLRGVLSLHEQVDRTLEALAQVLRYSQRVVMTKPDLLTQQKVSEIRRREINVLEVLVNLFRHLFFLLVARPVLEFKNQFSARTQLIENLLEGQSHTLISVIQVNPLSDWQAQHQVVLPAVAEDAQLVFRHIIHLRRTRDVELKQKLWKFN